MKLKYLLISSIIFLTIAVAGCAPKRDSLVESFRGTAFTLQKYNQIAASGQQVSDVPPAEMDGKAAVLVNKRYIETFREPEGPEYSLKVGSVTE